MMKIPQLKAFDCIDHDPIEEWLPGSEADVHYSLCLHIGPADEAGADLFHVEVTTPEAINAMNLGRAMGQRRIVVRPYSWKKVLDSVQATLESCTGDDWLQQSELLAKHFHWEFENYRQ